MYTTDMRSPHMVVGRCMRLGTGPCRSLIVWREDAVRPARRRTLTDCWQSPPCSLCVGLPQAVHGRVPTGRRCGRGGWALPPSRWRSRTRWTSTCRSRSGRISSLRHSNTRTTKGHIIIILWYSEGSLAHAKLWDVKNELSYNVCMYNMYIYLSGMDIQ